MSRINRYNGDKLGMYGIIAIVSVIVRELVLPNPFEYLGARGYVYNAMVGMLISGVSYYLVSRVDIKMFVRTLRSLLFLLFYSIISLAVWAMSIHSFAWWWILIIELIIVIPLAGVATLVEYKTQRKRVC